MKSAIPTKTINGKRYTFAQLYFKDYEAKRVAQSLRKQGYYVRVLAEMSGNIKRGGNVDRMEYTLWTRRK
jgi:hypothetical protein